MMNRSFMTLLGLAALGGCDRTPPIAELPAPAVTVARPIQAMLVEHDDYEGYIVAKEKVDVRSKVRGHLDKILFRDGEIVEAGQPLYEIDPTQFQAALTRAESDLKSSEAARSFAEAEFQRIARLVPQKAATREEQDLAQAKVRTAVAEVDKAKAAVDQARDDLSNTKISARISGKIGRTLVDVGNLINPGGMDTLLATIVAVDPVYVTFDVPAHTMRRYREKYARDAEQLRDSGQSLLDLKIPVYVGVENDRGYPHKGIVAFVNNQVDAGTGTQEVRAILPNPTFMFFDGMRARARLPVADPHPSLLLPERAILTQRGKKFVYVVVDGVAKRRDVELGQRVADLVEVSSGLKEGDEVIINGVQRARPELKVNPKLEELPVPEELKQPAA